MAKEPTPAASANATHIQLGDFKVPSRLLVEMMEEINNMDAIGIGHFKDAMILLLAGHNIATADDENFRYALHGVMKVLGLSLEMLRESRKAEQKPNSFESELIYYKNKVALMEKVLIEYQREKEAAN